MSATNGFCPPTPPEDSSWGALTCGYQAEAKHHCRVWREKRVNCSSSKDMGLRSGGCRMYQEPLKSMTGACCMHLSFSIQQPKWTGGWAATFFSDWQETQVMQMIQVSPLLNYITSQRNHMAFQHLGKVAPLLAN